MLGTWNLECTFLVCCYTDLTEILKILIFGYFMAKKLPKIQDGRHFLQFFGHKMPKIQNFQNRLARSVKHHTRKVPWLQKRILLSQQEFFWSLLQIRLINEGAGGEAPRKYLSF